MLYHLPNTLFMGGVRYRKGAQELPDHLDGVPVVAYADREAFAGKPYIVLPRGAMPLKEKPVAQAKAPAPTTLSQLAKGKVRTALDNDEL